MLFNGGMSQQIFAGLWLLLGVSEGQLQLFPATPTAIPPKTSSHLGDLNPRPAVYETAALPLS
jgi:hypothetical protein